MRNYDFKPHNRSYQSLVFGFVFHQLQSWRNLNPQHHGPILQEDEVITNVFAKSLQNSALCMAVAAALILPWSSAANVLALERGPVISELSVLISGPPIKDANALLRYALPINNKQIKEVQKSLEEITEDMKVPGEKALGSVERVCR